LIRTIISLSLFSSLDAFRTDTIDVVVSFSLTPKSIFSILLDRKSEFLSAITKRTSKRKELKMKKRIFVAMVLIMGMCCSVAYAGDPIPLIFEWKAIETDTTPQYILYTELRLSTDASFITLSGRIVSDNDNRLVSSDTIFNNRYQWTYAGYDGTNDCGGYKSSFDIRNIATHEFGHWTGLGDLYDNESKDMTMYGYASRSELKKSTLGIGDITGIKAVWP